MACAASVLNPRKVVVKIRNPIPGGVTHINLARARALVAKDRAYFDGSGQLVFYGRYVGRQRAGCDRVMDRFSGVDARPDRAVLPPSAEVLARMGNTRRPLRPPIAGQA